MIEGFHPGLDLGHKLGVPLAHDLLAKLALELGVDPRQLRLVAEGRTDDALAPVHRRLEKESPPVGAFHAPKELTGFGVLLGAPRVVRLGGLIGVELLTTLGDLPIQLLPVGVDAGQILVDLPRPLKLRAGQLLGPRQELPWTPFGVSRPSCRTR